MKWSSILHSIAAIAGVLGLLAVFAWWVALVKSTGFSLMFTPEHLYDDATILLLASIAFGIGTMIHQRQEKK